MKQYLRLFTLMGFFSALSLQNATAAAAAAASGAGDEEGTCSRLLKVANQSEDFKNALSTALSKVAEEPDIPGILNDPEIFGIVWGDVESSEKEGVLAVISSFDTSPVVEEPANPELMAFLDNEAKEEAASAALAAKFGQAAERASETGTHFDPTHAIFPKVQAISIDVRSAAQRFVESLKGCDDWDVHKFNKERISNVGADRHLFNTVMPALEITVTDHGSIIARVRALAEKVYDDNAAKLENINTVLGTIGPDTTTEEDGLEHRIIHVALDQVLSLVEIADKALDDTGTWPTLLLNKIVENMETDGGCMPGVLGRLIEIGLRSFSELATVSEIVEKINASAADPAAAGFGGAEGP